MAEAAAQGPGGAGDPSQSEAPAPGCALPAPGAQDGAEPTRAATTRIRDLARPQNTTDVLVASLADQLCAIVDDNYEIRVRLDSEDASASLQVQKLTVLINALLENVRRNIGRLSRLAEELEAKVHERTLKLNLIVKSSDDGVWLWDLGRDVVEYSPRWRTMVGLDDANLSSIEDWLGRVHPDDNERLRAAMRAHLQGSTLTLHEDYRIRHADGIYRWVWCRGRCHRDGAGRPVLMAGTQTDVHHLRSVDPMTGLPNESMLISALEDMIARHDDFHAMIIGVPRTVSMKEELGAKDLSSLRRAIASRLSAALPFTSTLAHLSGDFYAALVADCPSDDALGTQVMSPVFDAFEKPFEMAQRMVWLDVVIGATSSVRPARRTASEVMRDAWTSYRCAREAGKSGNILDEAQIEAARQRVDMQEMVRRGLDRDWFVPYFQPVVDIRTREAVGFETLCRMAHPELGMVSPGRFLPVADDLGLMDAIGDRMLDAAIGQLARWARMGEPFARLFLTVNLEAQQMLAPDFPESLQEKLAAHDVSASRLKLEIVESSMVGNFRAAARQIGLLRANGISIALDDFGTGHSSLEYLNELPFDMIKIDKSFVDEVEDKPNKQSMVNMICVLGETLGAGICVEGIQTEAQARIFSDMNVAFGQGYLFGKPVPADEL